MPIPRVLHWIWLGDRPVPDAHRRYRRGWMKRHPGWTLRCWTEETLPPDLQQKAVYETLRVPAERADILRLEVLWREGGVYIDTDVECLRPVDALIDGCEFVIGDSKPGRSNNAFIGAAPGHPILAQALREVRPRRFPGVDKHATGPHFLDRIVRQHPEARILEPWVIYPGLADVGRAYARHHRHRSWRDTEGLRRATARAETRHQLALEQMNKIRAEVARIRARWTDPALAAQLDRVMAMAAWDVSAPKVRRSWPGRRVVRWVWHRLRSAHSMARSLGRE
jgi:inositol phosphorylceramide mannosyltransferase catalytic subunit